MSEIEAPADIVDTIWRKLSEMCPKVVEGVTKELHQMPPFIPKAYWTELGNTIKKHENPPMSGITGDKWISLRLDGTGFSKLLKQLRRYGLFGEGYSPEFATIMQTSLKHLMGHSKAWIGYTQSDEMSLLIPPTRKNKVGNHYPHVRNGRVQKLASLYAAVCTAVFNSEVNALLSEKELKPLPVELLPTFDCRVGSYDTEKQALSLLAWRCYDSGINGVTDACYQKRGILEGAKHATTLGNDQKLKWLLKNNLLPLPNHQAHGTVFIKKLRPHKGFNPITNQNVDTFRMTLVELEGCLLTRFKNNEIKYVDERAEQTGDEDDE
eukprot:TRINITY_DN22005_c0_g1_i1.p1 TRINITY_DN22005_c0_g1~~TRINITY_DN22005_c0_g1_i1.p1  ORF type:complete len:323 (+),score=67.75 TRINITY_DN22005_c0_g1_i1:131-1099(+)